MSVDKSSVLKKLRESDAIYVLMSDCTRMPFVVCDPETYDDEVFVFFSEEDAMRGGQEFLKANNPLKIFNIEVCFDEERKLQEEKPPEKRGIMNETNYLRIKEYLEKNNER